jgi:addiction module HigA family antidote
MIHEPLHPGEIVREICIEGTGLSIKDFAEILDVDRTTVSRLINGHAAISSEMAFRLSMALNTEPYIWMNLQRDYDLWKTKKAANNFRIKRITDIRLAHGL